MENGTERREETERKKTEQKRMRFEHFAARLYVAQYSLRRNVNDFHVFISFKKPIVSAEDHFSLRSPRPRFLQSTLCWRHARHQRPTAERTKCETNFLFPSNFDGSGHFQKWLEWIYGILRRKFEYTKYSNEIKPQAKQMRSDFLSAEKSYN